jgi:hypothetical protein
MPTFRRTACEAAPRTARSHRPAFRPYFFAAYPLSTLNRGNLVGGTDSPLVAASVYCRSGASTVHVHLLSLAARVRLFCAVAWRSN